MYHDKNGEDQRKASWCSDIFS